MEYKHILFDIHQECIGVLTINRPDKLNALNRGTFREFNHLLNEIEANPAIRGLIITGSGRSFVVGADLSEIYSDGIEENRAYAHAGQSLLNRIHQLPIPTIAAVNGFALGGGCELSLACDIRIASEKAKFGQPEVDIGVSPCFGGTQRLPRLIGVGLAKELIFTGRKVKADEALNIGLVNRVVTSDELMSVAMEMMGELVTKSTTAIKYAKVAIDRGWDMSLADGLELEKDISAICYGLPDKAEGMAAFMEKRPPIFNSK